MTKGDDSTIDSSSDKAINSMNDRAAGIVMGTAGNSANLLGSTLDLFGARQSNPNNRVTLGELPSIEYLADVSVSPESGSVSISYTDYSATKLEMWEVTDPDDFLVKPQPD